jgi:hypothetical protein
VCAVTIGFLLIMTWHVPNSSIDTARHRQRRVGGSKSCKCLGCSMPALAMCGPPAILWPHVHECYVRSA